MTPPTLVGGVIAVNIRRNQNAPATKKTQGEEKK
jgi:hypothetical protein